MVKALVITPGIRNSRGHEIHGYAIEKALEKYLKVEVKQLKKLDTSLIGKLFIWPLIELVKDIIALFPTAKFDEVARGKIQKKYKEALTTRLIGRGLLNFLNKNSEYKDFPLISSHYAAIAAGKKARVKNLLLVGPDFFPHDQTAIPEIKITSPDDVFTKELIEFGVKKEKIEEIGAIVTPEAKENSKKYSQLRKNVAEGKQNPMHILITLGGAGPETKYVVETVKKLKELILSGHQLCSISVVVGDDRPERKLLRKKLLKIIKNQILDDTEGCGFRVFGGTKGFGKTQEVRKTWDLLASSRDTNGLYPVDLIFTRPNDISLISTAMGIPTILYKAVGSHEVKARHYLNKVLKCSVLFEEWLTLSQPGKIINLGKILEIAFKHKSIGFIKSDSGDELIKILSKNR